jgi:hypothetical protein
MGCTSSNNVNHNIVKTPSIKKNNKSTTRPSIPLMTGKSKGFTNSEARGENEPSTGTHRTKGFTL